MKFVKRTKLEQVVETVDGRTFRRERTKKNGQWGSWYEVSN